MSSITFAQSSACPQLYLADCGDQPPGSGRQTALLLPRGAATPAPTLDLAASWASIGCYLFLPAALPVERHALFAAAAWSALEQRRRQGARFAWFENPAVAEHGLRGRFLALYRAGEAWRTDRVAQLDFGGLTLLVAKGCPVGPAPDGGGFRIAAPAAGHSAIETPSGARYPLDGELDLPLCGAGAGGLRFACTLANAAIPDAMRNLDAGLRIFVRDPALPPQESHFFVTSLRYPLLSEDPADWSRYGADLTLHAALDPLAPLDGARTYFAFVGPDGGARPAALPSCYRTNIGYTVHLTPRDAQSRLVFAPRPADSQPGAAAPYYLMPAGEFEMTVPRYARGASPDPRDYDDNLLCGLSGVEYVKLDPERANLLCFYPGHAAFVPGFLPGMAPAPPGAAGLTAAGKPEGIALDWDDQAATDLAGFNLYRAASAGGVFTKLNAAPLTTSAYLDTGAIAGAAAHYRLTAVDTGGGEMLLAEIIAARPDADTAAPAAGLTDLATTAWAYVRQADGAAPIYYAQPDQAILYRPDPASGAGSGPGALLSYMETPAAMLPAPGDGDPPAFPLLPYGGVAIDQQHGIRLADYQQVEVQRLVPARRARIHELGRAAAAAQPGTLSDEGVVTGTTPQGLLATFPTGDAVVKPIKTLTLAKDTADVFLTFQDIAAESPLRSALQSNQLFLVISDPAALQGIFRQNQLTIRGWTFDLDPARWDKQDTILVFKFHEKAMAELAEDTQMWTLPAAFNQRPATTRRRLARLLQAALDRTTPDAAPKDRENYAQLARAARDPGWSGIIALNVTLGRLPQELGALAAGINQDTFYAQYVGVAATPVAPHDGELVAGQSSLFGLIDYQDDSALPPNESGYNFQVMRLQALFQNSQVKAFSSEVALTLDRLFDETTQLRDSPTGRNAVVFKGTAEDHNGQTTYAFSFSGENHFDLPASRVLNEVEIIKAQFTTDPPSAGRLNTTVGRFVFWGRLNFRRLEAFDVLSFGAEPVAGDGNTYLSFANLALTMSFPNDMPTQRTFDLQPGQLAFDMQRSKARADSLYAKFPLKFTGLVYSPGEYTIDDYGAMPVKTPLGGGKIEGAWYGLTFDLSLGSVGALAGKAGLVASLIAAWSPTGEGVFVGLRLPGSTGGKREIALQGVLKIVFKRIEFVVGDDGGRPSYLLKLKNIQLKFMVLAFPPGGQTEIIIFGDPRGQGENNTVGWYAAYAKEQA